MATLSSAKLDSRSRRGKADYPILSLKSIGMTATSTEMTFLSHGDSGQPERSVVLILNTEESAELIKRILRGAKQTHCHRLFDRAAQLEQEG
jgi:hypothetical protein